MPCIKNKTNTKLNSSIILISILCIKYFFLLLVIAAERQVSENLTTGGIAVIVAGEWDSKNKQLQAK